MKDTSPFLSLITFAIAFFMLLGVSILFSWNKPLAIADVGPETAASTTKQTYTDPALHYTITYPSTFTVNPLYSYKAPGPGQAIPGVSFTIPVASTFGTTLSKNSFISVESVATQNCSVQTFLGDTVATSTQTIVDKGVSYTLAKSSIGKKNQYEEYVYVLSGRPVCTAVRYFIQSTNTPGTVQAFDHASVVAQFDSIRRSLRFN